jgi:hypothetical protein
MGRAVIESARQSNLISPVTHRRFRLLDAMILVAAMAFACGTT